MKDILKKHFVITIFSALTLTVTITSFIMSIKPFLFERYNFWLYISIVMMFSVYVTFIFFKIRKNKKSVTIALLGFPNVGKTVYLTVLFNELQKTQDRNINFLPYGNETIDKVSSDISTLQLGNWLDRTAMEQFFYYRAITTIGGAIKNTYKLEIGDFAGEKTLDLSNCKWLHRDKYFDYTLQSDAIFLAISAHIFSDYSKKIETINSMIAAINLLSQKKGYSDTQKMREPICLLVLKSDVLINFDEEEYLAKISDLLNVCQKRSKFFKTFFVSSVGEVSGNSTPKYLEPRNVVEPLLWVLQHV